MAEVSSLVWHPCSQQGQNGLFRTTEQAAGWLKKNGNTPRLYIWCTPSGLQTATLDPKPGSFLATAQGLCSCTAASRDTWLSGHVTVGSAQSHIICLFDFGKPKPLTADSEDSVSASAHPCSQIL